MISKQEVKHIAKLARLGLTLKEEDRFAKELSAILDYVEKLKKIDVSRIEPTSHSIKVENVEREDKVNENLKMKNEEFSDLAPEAEKGYLKVKSILK